MLYVSSKNFLCLSESTEMEDIKIEVKTKTDNASKEVKAVGKKEAKVDAEKKAKTKPAAKKEEAKKEEKDDKNEEKNEDDVKPLSEEGIYEMNHLA